MTSATTQHCADWAALRDELGIPEDGNAGRRQWVLAWRTPGVVSPGTGGTLRVTDVFGQE
jgi:hypothetical protein